MPRKDFELSAKTRALRFDRAGHRKTRFDVAAFFSAAIQCGLAQFDVLGHASRDYFFAMDRLDEALAAGARRMLAGLYSLRHQTQSHPLPNVSFANMESGL